MKPNFALSLSFDGIRLLHRAAGGWRLVGEVSLDAADMGAELAMLRRTAASLEPGGVRSKLLIPNTQVRYLTIDTPGMEDADRLEAARAALEGVTPYPVSDLAFDISTDGDQTHVAAVARETLEEAEAFAVEHRFYPVSFAAVPDDQPYLGEPWFGPTDAAPGLLEEDERVEPDGIAVVILGATVASTLAASDVPDPGPAEVPEPDSPEVPERDDPAPSEPPAESPQPLDPEPPSPPEEAPAMMAADVPDPAPTEVPAPEAPEITDPGDPVPVEPPVESPQPTDPEPPSRPEEAPDTTPTGPTPVIPPREEPPLPDPQPDLPDETPATPPDEAPMPQDPPAPVPPPAAPPASAEAAAAWIPSLRAAREAEATRNLDASLPGPTRRPEAPGPAPSPGFASRRGAVEKAPARRREPVLVAVPATAAAAVPAAAALAEAPEPITPEPIAPDSRSLTPDPVPAEAEPPARPGFLSRRKPRVRTAPAATGMAAGAAVAAPSSEAERMTVFGARRGDVGGKPRFLGLMLTAALLVFLAGVAAWASAFLDDGLSLSRLFRDRAAEVASAPQQPDAEIADPEPLVLDSGNDTPGPVETASLEPGLSAEDGAVLDALSEPVAEEQPAPMTEEEVEARYAATGIWPRSPELPPAPAALIGIEDLYLTSIDPVSTASDAVALPTADTFTSDVTLAALPSPAAPGTEFDLGPDGLVEPTAEGAVTPDGALVILGRPPVVPPETPTRFQAVPQDTAERVALAAFRPRDRPEDLSENAERAQNDGLTNNELAGLRPRLRPQSVQEAAAEAASEAAAPDVVAPQDTDNAVAAALATPPVATSPAAAASLVAVAPGPVLENVTRNAAAQSIRPDTRPRNFNRIVRRAERTRPAQEDTEVVSAAAVAPRVVQPSIPSNASVAGTATMKNAINLRKVNLIGVYGKPSARRALVRLSNGSYKKVVVGDRIDGGRVAAIGDSELVYSKGGRNLVLKMPNG